MLWFSLIRVARCNLAILICAKANGFLCHHVFSMTVKKILLPEYLHLRIRPDSRFALYGLILIKSKRFIGLSKNFIQTGSMDQTNLLFNAKPIVMSSVETKAPSTAEIAARLHELCSVGQFETAQREFFSTDVISIEVPDAAGVRQETKGLDAVTVKREQFQDAVASVQGLKTSAPLVQGNSIAFEFQLDFTLKNGGPQRLAEIILYVVKDGKVVLEQFFN